ncbi:FkbM family methyltransferase [Cyanobacterium sp. Dongsha4]|uniref:FkbM family methyltransferase n=1 Tax=Cyanobacterium sp. DS4 TaxID=2878255 RepID=UPI002E819979|nr:FkbM family methyltransferase [Cyanobacterium sp. Dongsha4]WVL02445.1 FkbM family methyltransferase [Cyanobacterium sp. Dongsha4]
MAYSQEGEDLVLARFFKRQKDGFFVDVGAHHPQRFSNTYIFYLRGWKGINIDPLPNSMQKFNELRPNDINLELAISNNDQRLVYYQFNEPALNGFSPEISKERDGLRGQYKIISQTEIQTYKLSEILDQYLPSDQSIDFLSIDVEGLDLEVLKSNNWEKYRPKLILAEDLSRLSLKQLQHSKLVSFLDQLGYEIYAKTVNTLFFLDTKSQLKNEEV